MVGFKVFFDVRNVIDVFDVRNVIDVFDVRNVRNDFYDFWFLFFRFWLLFGRLCIWLCRSGWIAATSVRVGVVVLRRYRLCRRWLGVA